MNYLVAGIGSEIYVQDDNGKDCGGPYKNMESAKRRIRDLKRKELTAEPIAEISTNIAVGNEFPNDPAPLAVIHQVGCYPAVSKHAYRR